MENSDFVQSVTRGIIDLLPLFQKKLIKPVQQLTKQDTPPLQHLVLILLDESETLTMTDLAKELYISKPQLTPIIDKLVDRGLVQRETDAKDRRVINNRLTGAGKEHLKQMDKELYGILKQRIEILPPGELREIQSALGVLNKMMNKLP